MHRYAVLLLIALLVLMAGCTNAPPPQAAAQLTGTIPAETEQVEPTQAGTAANAPEQTEPAASNTEQAPQPSGAAETTADTSKTLIVGIPDDAATFDMLFATTPRSTQVIMNAYEPLMTYALKDVDDGLRQWDSNNVEGAVLESMTLDADGLTWTLKVREGMTFPSGAAINAETVKFMFERNFGVEGSGGAFIYSFVGRISNIEAVTVIDDYTLEVTTDQPNPLLPRIFVLSNSTPVDPTLIRANATDTDLWASEWMKQHTNGSGPYRLERWTPGVEIVLQANEQYWRGKPAIDRVEMRVIPSTADRMMLLAAQSIDVVEKLSAEEIEAVSRIPGLKVVSIPSTTSLELAMNNAIAPFDDVRVRQAIAYAIPYDDIIESVYFNRAQKSAGPVPVGFPDHNPGDYPYQQDMEQVRRLLATAGYADGFDINLELDSGNPDNEAVAVLIKAALEEIGVKVTIQKLTPAVFAEKRAEKRMAFFLNENIWWVDAATYPLQLAYVTGAFFNYPNYADEALDQQIAAAAAELDSDKRSAMLAEIQHKIIADVPLVWIAQPNFNLAMRENINGYVHFNDQLVRYYYLDKE